MEWAAAIVVWQDYITGTTSDIYAQRVAGPGSPVDGNGRDHLHRGR